MILKIVNFRNYKKMLHLFPQDISWQIFDQLTLYDFRSIATCCKDFRKIEFTIYLTRKWKIYDRRLWYKKIQWIRKYFPQRWNREIRYTKHGYAIEKIGTPKRKNQNKWDMTSSPPFHFRAKYPMSRVYSKFKFTITLSSDVIMKFGFFHSEITKINKSSCHYHSVAPSCHIELYRRGRSWIYGPIIYGNINYTSAPRTSEVSMIHNVETYICSFEADYKKKIIIFYINDVNVGSFGWSADTLPSMYPIVYVIPFNSIETKIQIIEDN